jgi:hypothetical protein
MHLSNSKKPSNGSHPQSNSVRWSSTCLGLSGAVLLILFFLALQAPPKRLDALLYPYGLFVLFGVLLAAIVLPTIAALRGSKWWFLVAAASTITAIHVFIAEMQ